jgi:RNA polymerase sigma-70 factor (ECF subfamily)
VAVLIGEVLVAQRRPRALSVQVLTSADDELAAAVRQAQQGSEAAFSRLYRAVQPALIRYLSTLVGTESEDVAAETWLQVCRDLHRFDGDGDGFRGWVMTIGRHRALDQIRARGRRPASAYPIEFLSATAGPDDTPTAAAESITTAAALRLIGALPPDQAEAVLLRAVIGLDAASAGRVLGKRPGAVRMSAHRGLRNLARQLDSDVPAAAQVGDGVTPGQLDALNEMT